MKNLFFHRRKLQPLGWAVVATALLLVTFVQLQPDQNLHVIACDVGQGDAILMIVGNVQVLVDGGPDDSVLSCLSDYVPFWDREIELVVLTNADADHMTGLIDVLGRYQVGRLVVNNLVKETARFETFRQMVKDSGVAMYAPRQGDILRLPGSSRKGNTVGDYLEFRVMWPEERLGDERIWARLSEAESRQVLGANTYSKSKGNEQSVVMKLSYGEFDVLLTGDIGEETEEALVERGLVEGVEVLKVGHHGSKYSSGSAFLSVVRPELALVSSGKNRYGHPTAEALGRLEDVGARVLRTDELGRVEIVSDGSNYWVK